MTCCVGMLASDGLVMAADTQQTYGPYDIGYASKITLAATGKMRLIMSGSGNTHFIDYTKAQIVKVAGNSGSIEEFETNVRGLMKTLYREEFDAHPLDKADKEVSLLVAGQFFGHQAPALFAIESTLVERIATVRVIGEERVSAIAQHFFNMRLSTAQTVWACLYIIHEAKIRSALVGGSTQVISIHGTGQLDLDDGTWDGAQREQIIGHIEHVARRLFIGVIPPTDTRIHEAEIQNLTDLVRLTRNELQQMDDGWSWKY